MYRLLFLVLFFVQIGGWVICPSLGFEALKSQGLYMVNELQTFQFNYFLI